MGTVLEANVRRTWIQRIVRALIWVAGSIVLVGFALWLIVQYDNYQNFRRELTEFRGVKLGTSSVEAKYALGYPHQVTSDIEIEDMPGYYRVYDVAATDGPNILPKEKTIDDFHDWSWKLGDETVNVIFDPKTKLITSITCYVDEQSIGYPNCSGLGSITAGESEESVLNILGPPDRVDFPKNSTTKTLRYNSVGLEVDLSKREVYRWTKKNPKDLGVWWWLTHGRPS